MYADPDGVVYQTPRLGVAVWVIFFVVATVLCIAAACAGIAQGEALRVSWLVLPLGFFGWMSYGFIANAIRPPKLKISREGLSWTDFDTFEGEANGKYRWDEIDGPELKHFMRNVPYVCFVVRTTGREFGLPLRQIGRARYDEVAAIVTSARAGKMVSPDEWRAENPRHSLGDWLSD